jgi:TfoX/Sxy family transcriptional regulator of competence genes
MASTQGYLDFIKEQLAGLEGVTWRKMMGEYLLYCRGQLVGGIYDDRLLLKPTPAALALLPDAPREQPYPGAKELLLVENVDDAAFLTRLLDALAAEEPEK